MKYILILFLFILSSCDDNIIMLGVKNRPFIVRSIEKVGDSISVYTGGTGAVYRNRLFFTKNPKIIAPTGMYYIGDTIKLIPSNKIYVK
jgi:hypothetical protein